MIINICRIIDPISFLMRFLNYHMSCFTHIHSRIFIIYKILFILTITMSY